MSSESLDSDDPVIQNIEFVVENQRYSISKKAAIKSNLVKTALESDVFANEIKFDKNFVDPNIIEPIIQYLTIHEKCETCDKCLLPQTPLKQMSLKDIVEPQDYDFISNLSSKQLQSIVNAASYMDIKPLLNLSCAQIAIKIKKCGIDNLDQLFA